MCNECGGKGKKTEEQKESTKDKDAPKAQMQKPKGPQPVLNVMGNISGMHGQGGPVTKMRMYYTKEEEKKPELNIDIDIAKADGSDEKFCLSTEPTEEELEKRQCKRLKRIECELEDLKKRLEDARQLRREWNAQKEGLCNRRLKHSPDKSRGPC